MIPKGAPFPFLSSLAGGCFNVVGVNAFLTNPRMQFKRFIPSFNRFMQQRDRHISPHTACRRTQVLTLAQNFVRKEAIALIGIVVFTSACSSARSTKDTETTAPQSSTLPELSTQSPDNSPLANNPTPPKANEIRTFLEQGSVEASSQCPSKSATAGAAIALKKVAYFETTHYWVGICAKPSGDLEYYGRKRDNPELDLTLLAYASGVQPQEFIAQNGNTLYKINPTELIVTQNGVPIVREPVLRSSFD